MCAFVCIERQLFSSFGNESRPEELVTKKRKVLNLILLSFLINDEPFEGAYSLPEPRTCLQGELALTLFLFSENLFTFPRPHALYALA